MAAKLGLQLYTLRDQLPADYRGVMEKVAAAGYVGVEPAGFPGSSLEEALGIYRDLGLTPCSTHFQVPVGDQAQEVIEHAQALGVTRCVSGRGPDDYTTEDKVKESCEIFNQAARNLAPHGMTFHIHNHYWEFEPLNGTPVFQLMLEHLDPAVGFQVDTYWVQTGGGDPVAVIRELGDRAPLLHIKDGPCTKEDPMTAVGEGVMDFAAITEAAQHTEWFIVELDRCATDMVEAVEKSAAYLRKQGFVESF